MEKLIYLDNAATTKTSPEVVSAMLPYFTEHYGNPSSVYGFAAANKEVITKQREIIAGVLGAKSNEIYFTAGGTESDNWALTATAEAYAAKGKHIITSKIEHHAILHTCEYLEKRGYEVQGFDTAFSGNIPLGAGLSSSAALESVFAFALNDLLQFGIDRFELARIGQATEHNYCGVNCGIMDQFASLFGKAGSLIPF